MERAISVFIWLAVAIGFGYGLLFTKDRFLPALGCAVIFGIAAILVVGVVSVLAEVASRLVRRGRQEAAPPPRSGDAGSTSDRGNP
jgi:putative Mn2+ efflux pump MntP